MCRCRGRCPGAVVRARRSVSVIAGAVTQALLPRFAEFLAADYARWASGEDRNAPVGSFAEEDETRGDGVKAEAGVEAEADLR